MKRLTPLWGEGPRGRCITPNYRVACRLIETRGAIGILPEHMCADFLADPALRATPLEHRQEAWLLVQNHRKRDPAARSIIDGIRETRPASGAVRPRSGPVPTARGC